MATDRQRRDPVLGVDLLKSLRCVIVAYEFTDFVDWCKKLRGKCPLHLLKLSAVLLEAFRHERQLQGRAGKGREPQLWGRGLISQWVVGVRAQGRVGQGLESKGGLSLCCSG